MSELTSREVKKIFNEAVEELEAEKGQMAKEHIKRMLKEYHMAKATVARIERQIKKVKKLGLNDEILLLR